MFPGPVKALRLLAEELEASRAYSEILTTTFDTNCGYSIVRREQVA